MFTRNFLAVAGINLFIMMPYYMLFVISTPYAVERFKATPGVAGLVAGTMILGGMTGRFASGRFIGIFGSRAVLLFGIAEFILTMSLYLAANSLPLLIAVRFLSGIGVGCVGAVTGTMIAHIVPVEQHGAGISYFSLSTILAMALGPLLGILLLQHVSFSFMFLLCCAFALVSLVFALLLTAAIQAAGWTRGNPAPFRLSDYLEYRALPISFVMLLVAQGYGCVQAFMAPYAEKLGLEGTASIFFLVYGAVVLVSRPMTGKVMDTRGENIIIYPSLLILLCGLLLMAYAQSAWTFLLSAALIGGGFGNFQSTTQIISVKVVPRARFAQATASFFILLDLGIGFGPYIFGNVIPLAGYSGLFLSLSAATLAAIPLYHVLHGRKAGPRVVEECAGEGSPL